jgi:hypothetical protein
VKSWGSQRDRILRLLQSRTGQWVPLYEITPLAAQYNTRIKELRERGHTIDNHTRHVDGVVHSWFRWVRPKPQAGLFGKPQEVPTETGT